MWLTPFCSIISTLSHSAVGVSLWIYSALNEASRWDSRADVFPFRMKEMASSLEKQHSLLKLIIQKMEITSEADEYDGPVNVRSRMWPNLTQRSHRGQTLSRWVPLMKAIESKRKWRRPVLANNKCIIKSLGITCIIMTTAQCNSLYKDVALVST